MTQLYEIWLGKYSLGQGYEMVKEPEYLGSISAKTFELACFKYELQFTLTSIIKNETKPEKCTAIRDWCYYPESNSNGWTGPYFKSREDALESFKPKTT